MSKLSLVPLIGVIGVSPMACAAGYILVLRQIKFRQQAGLACGANRGQIADTADWDCIYVVLA